MRSVKFVVGTVVVLWAGVALAAPTNAELQQSIEELRAELRAREAKDAEKQRRHLS